MSTTPLIVFDKTTKAIDLIQKAKTDEMSKRTENICNLFLSDSSKFDCEKAFSEIVKYIKEFKRIVYSQISNTVYACFDKHNPDEAANKIGSMLSNIEKTLDYASIQCHKPKNGETSDKEAKIFADAENILIKIWDHVNLAQTQYSGLKQTDEEYKRKFDDSIAPFKEEVVKDMNAQLLTMVSIFTALAFLVFGGISSLGSIFSNYELPLLKVIVIGCIWGLCLLNLIFIFLFCIGKMTGLNFKSNRESNANIVQKYPIVWWSDLIILTILSGTLWTYYIRTENMDSWFVDWCNSSPQLAMCLGFGVIVIVFILATIILWRMTWRDIE